MLEPVVHPLPSRIINRAGAALRAAGLKPLSYDPQAFKERARRVAGLQDFGETDFEEGLSVLCDSVEKDARLLLTGRLAFRDGVTNALVTRLRRVEARKRSPEIFSRPLVPPLIVLGFPRSGTTLLHRLLSLAEEARSPVLWELQEPIRGAGPDRRRERSIKQVALLKKAAPGIDAKHHIDPDEPEEDVFLFDSSLWSLSFWMLCPVYGYLAWYIDHDPMPGYRTYREHLQIFQAESPGKRLTLKAPAHTGFIGPLLEAVPEAMIVQTHRDPVPVANSVNSLFYTMHGYLTERVDIERTAAVNLDLFERYFERNMAARERIPAGRILDVRYDDLTADPIGTVRRIYDHFGLELQEGFEATLAKWMAERPQHKFGKHVYAAEDFGMTDARIAARFKPYIDRFLEPPGAAAAAPSGRAPEGREARPGAPRG